MPDYTPQLPQITCRYTNQALLLRVVPYATTAAARVSNADTTLSVSTDASVAATIIRFLLLLL